MAASGCRVLEGMPSFIIGLYYKALLKYYFEKKIDFERMKAISCSIFLQSTHKHMNPESSSKCLSKYYRKQKIMKRYVPNAKNGYQ